MFPSFGMMLGRVVESTSLGVKQGWILPLEGRVVVFMVPQAAHLELRPWGLMAASSASPDRAPLSLFLFTILLLYLVTADGEVEWYTVHFSGGPLQQSRLEVAGSSFR